MFPRTRSRNPELVNGIDNINRPQGSRRPLGTRGPSISIEQPAISTPSSPYEFFEVEHDLGEPSEPFIEVIPNLNSQGDTVVLGGSNSPSEPPTEAEEVQNPSPRDPPTMAQPGINPLVMPRGLPIVVPNDLEALPLPSDLPKFHGTKDEDPSHHVERFLEMLATCLVTNQGYRLVWFPTTLKGAAYEWYRNHAADTFATWEHLQRDFLNHFRPEVGQSAALRALAAIRQGRDEDMTSYIRRFELVCTRFVGTMLNDDTLRQFFIQGFAKDSFLKGVLERRPATLMDAKGAAREVEAIDKEHERLWRREDQTIPSFIPIHPRVAEPYQGHPGNSTPMPLNQAEPYPQPLGVRAHLIYQP